MAYEEDTHFQITYVLCRAAGMSPSEAMTVAAVDQGMDDSPGTVANSGITPHVPEEWKWHALDLNGTMHAQGVIRRKEELFNIACSRRTTAQKLICLGVFFHFQQDTWAHRHHYDGDVHSYDRYTTYNTPAGHALHGHQPDRPPFDPVSAIMSLEDGIKYATRFISVALNREPRLYMKNYQPKGGTVLTNWPDDRNGMYFHQLSPDGPEGYPRKFLTELIRYQVSAYSTSWDYNPEFFYRKTADEANFDFMRNVLQGVCNRFAVNIGDHIDIPTRQQKEQQGFTTMTTAQLEAGMK